MTKFIVSIWVEDALTHDNLTEKAKKPAIDTYALICLCNETININKYKKE